MFVFGRLSFELSGADEPRLLALMLALPERLQRFESGRSLHSLQGNRKLGSGRLPGGLAVNRVRPRRERPFILDWLYGREAPHAAGRSRRGSLRARGERLRKLDLVGVVVLVLVSGAVETACLLALARFVPLDLRHQEAREEVRIVQAPAR